MRFKQEKGNAIS